MSDALSRLTIGMVCPTCGAAYRVTIGHERLDVDALVEVTATCQACFGQMRWTQAAERVPGKPHPLVVWFAEWWLRHPRALRVARWIVGC